MSWRITIVKSLITISHGGKLKDRGNLPENFNCTKYWFCGKLPWYFYQIDPWLTLQAIIYLIEQYVLHTNTGKQQS